jgi:hypothetical protein
MSVAIAAHFEDGVIDVTKPEALMYEPLAEGARTARRRVVRTRRRVIT